MGIVGPERQHTVTDDDRPIPDDKVMHRLVPFLLHAIDEQPHWHTRDVVSDAIAKGSLTFDFEVDDEGWDVIVVGIIQPEPDGGARVHPLRYVWPEDIGLHIVGGELVYIEDEDPASWTDDGPEGDPL